MRIGTIRGLAWAAGVACVAMSPARAAPAAPRISVVLITLDTTRADHLGCYGAAQAGTKQLDALARTGVRFDQALAVAPLTLPSHATMLSGLVPRRHGVRDNAGFTLSASVPLLTERLRDAGHATAAFVSAAVLDRSGGLDRGFGIYDDSVRIGERRAFDYQERAASQTVDAVLARLADLPAPFFLWVHLYDPHLPYVPPEPFASRFAGRPYDGEIAFMDAEVGRLLDALRRTGTPLLIAVAGDHGESLGEHGEASHGVFVYQATQRVPLILSGPGVPAGKTIAAPVGLVDLAPTLLDLAGAPGLDGVDGRSLVPLLRGARAPGVAYEMESFYPAFAFGWAPLRALAEGGYKVIEAPRRELYALPADPRETRDLAAAQPERLARMAASLAERVRGDDAVAPAEDAATGERRERLASLGYVGGSRPPDAGAIDPKDGIALLPGLDAARRAIQLGDPDDAIAPLERLLAKNPANMPARLSLGQAQLASGKVEGAIATYRDAVGRAPTSAIAWFDLGNALSRKAAKDDAAWKEAKSAYERALALAPRHADTYVNYAGMQITRRAIPEARETLLRARAAGVADPEIETQLGAIERARKDPAAAEAAFTRAIALNPREARALAGLGELAYAAGAPARAAGLYARALEAEPSAATAKTLGAIRLNDLDDRAGARAAFARAVALSSPSDPDLPELRALIQELSP